MHNKGKYTLHTLLLAVGVFSRHKETLAYMNILTNDPETKASLEKLKRNSVSEG